MSAPLSVADISRQAAPALVQLELPTRRGTAFFLGPSGHLVTNLHVVIAAPWIRAHLHDGRVMEVTRVVGVDSRRDLAVLALEAPGHGAFAFHPAATVRPDERLFALGVAPDTRLQVHPAGIHAVQVVGDWLTVLELACNLPESASGGPLIGQDGQLVGIATVARSAGRDIALGIPLRYLAPLFAMPGGQPLTALGLSEASRRGRSVPHHSLSLLEDSSVTGLEMTALFLGESLELGASAAQRGDLPACVQIYLRSARQLLALRDDCPGVQRALRQGVQRAAGLEELSAKAWAMRDCFEGILSVVRRWFEAQAALTQFSHPPSSVN